MSTIDKASLIQIPSGYKNGKLYSVKPTPTYGSELVTNGGFDTDSDWSDVNNVSTITGGQLVFNNSTVGGKYQSTSMVIGKLYKLTYTIVSISNGYIQPRLGDTGYATQRTSAGTYSENIVCLSDTILRVYGGTSDGVVDNVSVKEITNIGDFDFSRSSSATRVNSEGLIEVAGVVSTTEQVNNGDFSGSSTGWTESGTWTYGNNNEVCTGNGTNQVLTQSGILTTGTKYKYSIDIISSTLNSQEIRVYLGGTDYVTYTLNGGAETISAYADAAGTNLSIRVTSSNTSGVLTIDNVSVKEVIENDVPRLDYSGGASCASLLLEPQTQNLVTYSEDFSQWSTLSSNAATYISDLVNPDGSVGGYKVSGSGIYLGIGLLTTTQRSIYARSVSGSGDVQLFTHNSNTNNIFTLTEEWQRFDVNSITSASAVGNYYIDLRGVSSTLSELYVWGAQATNDQSYVTSYIPSNSGSSTTRTADVCNNAGTSATFNSTEGVLFAEIAALANDGTKRRITINNGSSTQFVQLEYSVTTNTIKVGVYNGSLQGFFTETLSDLTTFNKIAYSYKANEFKLFANGIQLSTTITSGSTFSSGTLTTLSFDNGASADDFYGKTKQLMVFDEALSDEELSDLTGQVNLSFNNLATFYGYTIL